MNGKHWIIPIVGAVAAITIVTCTQIAPTESDKFENIAQEGTSAPKPHESIADDRLAETSPASNNATTTIAPANSEDSEGGHTLAESIVHAPTPMTADGIRRVSKFADGLATKNERQKEFLALSRNEEKDPQWSPQMQDALASSLRNNFGRRGGLEVSDIQCTRTICTMSAVVANSAAPSQSSDWQALMRSVMNEPWFGDHFFDASTTMGTDDKGLIYLTYFVRKKGE